MSVPAISNVFLVAFSGVSYAEVIGSPNAPNINGYAAKYASSSNFSALAYPALPNVLALSGGSTEGVTSNSLYQRFPAVNLFQDRIAAQGMTWKIYAENLPADPTTTSGGYSYFYNPQIFYNDAYAGSGSDAHIVAYTQLATDLTGLAAPNLAWILPNSSHNMSAGPSAIAAGDTWVSSTVSSIQSAYPNSLTILWWDSDDGTGGNVVPLLFLSPQLVEVGYSSKSTFNHYNLLATIGKALGLNPLGVNDTVAMDEFFAQGPAGGIFSSPVWAAPVFPSTLYQGSELFFQFDAQANPFAKYSVASGSLPEGLVLDPDFGTLTGAPSTIGTYSFAVTATNGIGSATTATITTQVIIAPVATPPAINPDADPTFPNFTDPLGAIVDGSNYYFTVAVNTSAGTGPVSAPSAAAPVVQAPDPVTTPGAVGGNASAVVSWTPPTDTGGLPLSGYVITVMDETLGASSSMTVPVVTSVNIPGLSNGHYYSFVIQAANSSNKILGRGVPTQAVLCSGISNIISLNFPNPPVNTPQPNYPTSVVAFTPVTDYPESPGDVGAAFNINALHSEVWAVEQALGKAPLSGLPYMTLQAALLDLAVGKALLGHTHSHTGMDHKDHDDHWQYAKLDGSRPFTGPVTAPQATGTNQLVTLSQVQNYGFNMGSLTFGANPVVGATAASVDTAVVPPLNFRADQSFPWMVVGGLFSGLTAPDGLIQIAFSPAWETFNRFSQMVITFEYTFTSIPANPTGVPYFNPRTDSVDLYWVDLSHAVLYVSSTQAGLPQRFIGLTWKALGL